MPPPSPDSLSLSTAAPPAASLSHSGSVRGVPSTDTPAARKLQKAAVEFESMLLSNLWKSMKGSFAPSDDESADPAHEVLDDMGIQAMSSAVGKSGGLGLAKLILKHLEPMLATHASGPELGKASALPADTFLEAR
jgi:Rod binding domain-containing protein